MQDIQWKYTRDNVSKERLEFVEDQLGFKFPDEYITIVKSNNGGRPNLNTFVKGNNEFIIKSLLRLDAAQANIIDVKNDLKGRLPARIVPFADDNFGNYFCFDYRDSNEDPDIVFYEHEETDVGAAIKYLSDSFHKFINSLS